jgi:hypothetical protein
VYFRSNLNVIVTTTIDITYAEKCLE